MPLHSLNYGVLCIAQHYCALTDLQASAVQALCWLPIHIQLAHQHGRAERAVIATTVWCTRDKYPVPKVHRVLDCYLQASYFMALTVFPMAFHLRCLYHLLILSVVNA